ncbi:hypothetical protein LguiA_009341 [Lonicera macranthoides]
MVNVPQDEQRKSSVTESLWISVAYPYPFLRACFLSCAIDGVHVLVDDNLHGRKLLAVLAEHGHYAYAFTMLLGVSIALTMFPRTLGCIGMVLWDPDNGNQVIGFKKIFIYEENDDYSDSNQDDVQWVMTEYITLQPPKMQSLDRLVCKIEKIQKIEEFSEVTDVWAEDDEEFDDEST